MARHSINERAQQTKSPAGGTPQMESHDTTAGALELPEAVDSAQRLLVENEELTRKLAEGQKAKNPLFTAPENKVA
jgi:hypothetical protein